MAPRRIRGGGHKFSPDTDTGRHDAVMGEDTLDYSGGVHANCILIALSVNCFGHLLVRRILTEACYCTCSNPRRPGAGEADGTGLE